MARLTERQRQSAKASREKAKRKWIRSMVRRTMIVFGSATLAYALGMGWWFFRSGGMERVVETARQYVFAMTADGGFVLRHVYVDGRKYTPLEKITEAVGMKQGSPILATSVGELRDRLQSLDRVRYAEIERVLPDTLHIHIGEREPVALWQNKGEFHLVDGEGVVIRDAAVSADQRLPLVVGEDAPLHTPQLLVTLSSEPELFGHVQSAVRVGERRWNIRFKNGVEVKLPEKDQAAAWHRLAGMEREQKVLSRDIQSIDLRLNDRVFIKLSPDAEKPVVPVTGKARET